MANRESFNSAVVASIGQNAALFFGGVAAYGN